MPIRDAFSPAVHDLLAEDDGWLVAETSYHPTQNLVYESNFCLASGLMGSRAVHEEGFIHETLPACYVHGVFDRSEAFQRELCNTPDWAKLKMYYEREPISPGIGEIRDYLRVLDMQGGLLAKRYVHLQGGRETLVESVKFLSRSHPRCGLLRDWITPRNYGGVLEFENIIDGTVTNFTDFPRFLVKHLSIREVASLGGEGAFVRSKTRDFGLELGTGAQVKVWDTAGKNRLRSRAFRPYGEVACEFFDGEVRQGETLILEKYAAVCTGRDFAHVGDAVENELNAVMAVGFDAELAAHKAAYAALWDKADLRLEGDKALQHALRFNIFHLMSTANPYDSRVGIGAKLIHGEEYGGHSFWDTELFIRPFFDYVFPDMARNLVEYRYHLLEKARENARKNGYEGAQYPWESADTGEEECPRWTIEPDGTCYRCHVAEYEHHVTAAVAFGAARYFETTGDEDYFENQGLEILAETARFWASRLEYDEAAGQYGITRVTGPDEWHEPVDNNAYTNQLAQWNLRTALHYLEKYRKSKPKVYQRIARKIVLIQEELQAWQAKAGKIKRTESTGLIEQFDGYFDLAHATVDRWDHNRMPLLPESLRDIPRERRCILKQADVVMLLFLLDRQFDLQTQRENFHYYEARTLHRSSLSPGVHCIVGLRTGESGHAYEYLERSAYVDLRNNQGNTREGIHAASAGITWQSVTLGYCGLWVRPDGSLSLNPRLPQRWESVSFTVRHRGATLRIRCAHGAVTVCQQGGGEPVRYFINGQERMAEPEPSGGPL